MLLQAVVGTEGLVPALHQDHVETALRWMNRPGAPRSGATRTEIWRDEFEAWMCGTYGCSSTKQRKWVCTLFSRWPYHTFITAKGRLIRHEDMWALAAEAERGYDVGRMKPHDRS